MGKIIAAVILSAVLILPALAEPIDPAAFDAPQPVTIQGYDGNAMEPFLSRDGTTLFFNNLNDPSVNTDIHWATPTSTLAFLYKGPVVGVNTEKALEGVPSLDRKGNFYFITPRAYGRDSTTIFTGAFKKDRVTAVHQVQGDLSPRRLFWFTMDCEISSDGNTLYFTDNRMRLLGGPPATSDFIIAHKTASGIFRRDPASGAIMRNVNETNSLQYAASTSGDELTLYFTRLYWDTKDIGIYVATRTTKESPFGKPQRISAITGFVEGPTVTPDGCGIYFHRKGTDAKFRIWYAHKTGCGKT